MRAFFAMEERGELPKGTARKWAKETKNTKSLPERKMEKNGMFFEEREVVEDGNFMKLASFGNIGEVKRKAGEEIRKLNPQKVKPIGVQQEKPVAPNQSPPRGRLPVKQKDPEPAYGTGCKLAMPFGTGIGVGGSAQFGGSGAAQTQVPEGAGGTPAMGTGEKLKKKMKKQAEGWADVPEKVLKGLSESGKGVVRGFSDLSAGAAKTVGDAGESLAKASPAAQAAALGIPAYMIYRTGKKSAKALANLGKKVPPKKMSLIRKLLTRGR